MTNLPLLVLYIPDGVEVPLETKAPSLVPEEGLVPLTELLLLAPDGEGLGVPLATKVPLLVPDGEGVRVPLVTKVVCGGIPCFWAAYCSNTILAYRAGERDTCNSLCV